MNIIPMVEVGKAHYNHVLFWSNIGYYGAFLFYIIVAIWLVSFVWKVYELGSKVDSLRRWRRCAEDGLLDVARIRDSWQKTKEIIISLNNEIESLKKRRGRK